MPERNLLRYVRKSRKLLLKRHRQLRFLQHFKKYLARSDFIIMFEECLIVVGNREKLCPLIVSYISLYDTLQWLLKLRAGPSQSDEEGKKVFHGFVSFPFVDVAAACACVLF